MRMYRRRPMPAVPPNQGKVRSDPGWPVAPPLDSPAAGFTILEILVVLTIIGLLIGLVAPATLRQLSGARLSISKQSIDRLGTVLDLYSLDIGSYPTTQQGLEALVKKPSGAANWNGPYLKGDTVAFDPG